MMEVMADYPEARARAEAESRPLDRKRKEPQWRAWNTPILHVPSIQTNANGVVVEKSEDSIFDYWLRISTLDKGNPSRVPVKLAPYHTQALSGHPINTSTALPRRRRR